MSLGDGTIAIPYTERKAQGIGVKSIEVSCEVHVGEDCPVKQHRLGIAGSIIFVVVCVTIYLYLSVGRHAYPCSYLCHDFHDGCSYQKLDFSENWPPLFQVDNSIVRSRCISIQKITSSIESQR